MVQICNKYLKTLDVLLSIGRLHPFLLSPIVMYPMASYLRNQNQYTPKNKLVLH